MKKLILNMVVFFFTQFSTHAAGSLKAPDSCECKKYQELAEKEYRLLLKKSKEKTTGAASPQTAATKDKPAGACLKRKTFFGRSFTGASKRVKKHNKGKRKKIRGFFKKDISACSRKF